MAAKSNAPRTSAGVEKLIKRLREDGVAAGRSEAERLLADAQAEARTILEKAEAEAARKKEEGRMEGEKLRRAGEDALRAATRDTVLDFKQRLTERFAQDVGKAVSAALVDEALLQEMILVVAGRAREEASLDKAKKVEMILPRTAVGLDDLRRKPEELREGTLTHFVAAMAGEMLRAGITFGRAEDEAGGIRLTLPDDGVSIDLTDRAVAEAILVHLQPRFRALLEGVVK